MNLIMEEGEIPEHLLEFFEPLKAEFVSVLAINTNKMRGKHYAPYPKEIVTPAILSTSPPDGLVIDPFCGSGTTGIVALENKRNFVGIELIEASATIALERLGKIIS